MKTSLIFKISSYILLGNFLLGVAGCTPNPLDDLSVADSQVFITNYNRNVNFNNYATFSIPDSVQVVNNNQVGYANDNFSLALINRTVQNLESSGFRRVARNQQPELGVNITYLRQTQTGVTVNPYSYYDPFYWGYGPGVGFASPYLYYQVSEALWYVEILDLKNANENGNTINVIWSAQIRGEGLTQNPNRIIDAIFEQSTYLRKR